MLAHMVIRLGKYLRIIGCDADWDLRLRTHELIRRANAEGRVFVTCNRRLPHQFPPAARVFTLAETDPVQQFALTLRTFGIDPLPRLFSQRIRCNVRLAPVTDKASIRAQMHPNV